MFTMFTVYLEAMNIKGLLGKQSKGFFVYCCLPCLPHIFTKSGQVSKNSER